MEVLLRGFRRILYTNGGGGGCLCVSLGKIKFRAFPKRVGPRITLKQVNTTEWLKTEK